MTLDSSAVVPVLDETLGLMEEALLAQQVAQEKIATKDRTISDLQQRLTDQEKIILEKVAKQNLLHPGKLDQFFDHLENLQVMSPSDRVKIAHKIKEDPNLIFPLFEKVADILSGVPSEGAGINREGPSPTTIDPDGWDDMAAHRQVQIRR